MNRRLLQRLALLIRDYTADKQGGTVPLWRQDLLIFSEIFVKQAVESSLDNDSPFRMHEHL